MATGLEAALPVREIALSNISFGPQEIRAITNAIAEDFSQHSVLRNAVAELASREGQTPASAVRLGVCQYLLGRYEQAAETLANADGGAVAHFYLGRSKFELGHYEGAISGYESARTAGYDPDYCALAIAEAHRYNRDAGRAMELLDQMFGPIEQTSEYLYQRGATVAAIGSNPDEVVRLYERAVEADGRHPGALFGLALENDRRGNDERALRLYQQAADCFPTHVGVLLNLGVLYEDLQQYERSRVCYQRILDCYPGHARAQLYFKDADASGDMFYDEEAQKRHDRLTQILNVPVTDFELSVRSRNCLQKMGILTLGDLTRTTEAELLASKNFGETSLVEIRDMLTSKGLDLGQFAHERVDVEPSYDLSNLSPDEQALLSRPISDLNLSVRARKCMVRLGLSTIGELVRKTGDDLLECKNFGVTSLNEVRDKLTQYSIKLRGD
ncbi:MAG: tetratricopeptide repeat protein [Planctomycetes bacterium]|nr:tetratricopeptide repeat protein [Planctomycetota bacterium]MBL7037145.1 tetratricopeptide repeat protein [Pirellulaceae bacterium]